MRSFETTPPRSAAATADSSPVHATVQATAPSTATAWWRDGGQLAVMALVLGLMVLSFVGEEGYQIADSVEYMERALIFVRGEEMVDSGAIRPFGFSSLLLPFVMLSDWFGVPGLRSLAWAITAFQMLLGLGLVAACMRIGMRLGGRSAGLCAGVLVGVNPVFLQYAVQPVSGIATGLFVALALYELIERQGFRRSLVGGLWLGAAFLMKYQTILIIGSVGLLLIARDRSKHKAPLGGVTLGVTLALAVQIVLDKLTYGVFGLCVWNHFIQNFQVLVTIMHTLSQHTPEPISEPLLEGATTLYGWINTSVRENPVQVVQTHEDLPRLMERWFYVVFLSRMLVWPVIGLTVLAIGRSLLRANWKSTFLFGVIVINLVAMSYKGSKEFRLWMPLMGAVAPFAALGFSTLVDAGRLQGVRRLAAVLALVAAIPLALRELALENTRKFGGYWQAMAYVNELALETLPERERLAHEATPPLVVGSAYNWAVYMRQSPLVHLVKLPWQLNSWASYSEESRKRQDDFDALDELDVLITHLPILDTQPDLLDWVNRHFAVTAAFYDKRTYEDIGPILVLERRRGGTEDKRFYAEGGPIEDPEAYRERWKLRGRATFGNPASGERLELLGYRYDVLPPQGLGWITYHWTSPTGFARDYTILDRLTAPDERNAWDNGHGPAYGTRPTGSWEPGTSLREGYIVVAAAEPFKADGPFRPVGGGFRRGDTLPLTVWMKLVEYDREALEQDELVELARLERLHDFSGRPIVQPTEETRLTPDGERFSPDGLAAIGTLMMPVQPAARVPDDGRPIPEDR